MESTLSYITNFCTDGILGNVVRFVFDRIFGGFFRTNVNLSNFKLSELNFTDLELDPTKINAKYLKNAPFKLFSGNLGSLSIKMPPLKAILTESLEIRIERLDLLLAMNDIDFSKAEQEVEEERKNQNSKQTNSDSVPTDKSQPEQEFDVYKKIINRILLNMKIKIKSLSVRILCEKPYKNVRLPVAPCFMLKVNQIEFKKTFEAKENNPEAKIFTKNQNYEVKINGITAHMLNNWTLETDEYSGCKPDPTAVFPFTYPNESHPSTILVCAVGTNKEQNENCLKSSKDGSLLKAITIKCNLSNDRSKAISIVMPHVEIMFDFLKVKYFSKYVDKILEWKKYSDYKKALILKVKPQVSKPRKSSESVDDPEKKNRKMSENDKDPSPKNSMSLSRKLKIGGYEIDMDYMKKNQQAEASSEKNDVNQSKMFSLDEITDLVNDPTEITADNILDTTNITLNFELRGLYIYYLKFSTAFMDHEFKRVWIFGNNYDGSTSFNKRIPINYYLSKATQIKFGFTTKDSAGKLTLSSFKILDVNYKDTPIRVKELNQSISFSGIQRENSIPQKDSNQSSFRQMNMSRTHLNKSIDVFHSIKSDSGLMALNIRRETSKNFPSNDSSIYLDTTDEISKDFLDVRTNKKPLLEWQMDSKRAHFCINVVFKFNKKPSSATYSKERRGYKGTIKYLDDSVIHACLNTGRLEEIDAFREDVRFRIDIGVQAGKTSLNIKCPAIYTNFYMSLVEDLNNLLHNASESYKFIELWYQRENFEFLKQWDQEYKDTGVKSATKVNHETINALIDSYFQEIDKPIEVKISVQLFKLVINNEEPKLELANTTCFCGFSAHFMPECETLKMDPIFTKDFIIIEIPEIAFTLKKTPLATNFSVNKQEKFATLDLQLLFLGIDVFLPSIHVTDNHIFFSKLFSINYGESKDKDKKAIITSISYKKFEQAEAPQEIIHEDMIQVNSDDNIFKFDNKNAEARHSKYQQHMNASKTYNGGTFSTLENDAESMFKFSVPEINLYVSKYHLDFLVRFSDNLKQGFDVVNQNLRKVLKEEALYFQKIIESQFPEKAPSTDMVQAVIGAVNIYVFRDRPYHSELTQMFDQKRKKTIYMMDSKQHIPQMMNISLDQSYGGNLESSISGDSGQNTVNLRCNYPKEIFLRSAKSNFLFSVQEIESIIYRNPEIGVFNAHLEIYDLLVLDRDQLEVRFGGYEIRESIDLKNEMINKDLAAYQALIYKQSLNNSIQNTTLICKTIEDITGDIDVLQYDFQYRVFEQKLKNVFSLGFFSYKDSEGTKSKVDTRISSLNIRSDFQLEVVSLFRDLLTPNAPEKQPESQEEEKEPGSPLKKTVIVSKKSSPASDSSEAQNSVSIELVVQKFMIDFNPYFTYKYCEEHPFEAGINLVMLDKDKAEHFLYSGMRSVLALRSFNVKVTQTKEELKFCYFNLEGLDYLMRNSRLPVGAKENKLILRPGSPDTCLFDSDYKELTKSYGFNSHPLCIENFTVRPDEDIKKKFNILLKTLDVKIFADTIPALIKQGFLISYLLGGFLKKQTQPKEKEKDCQIKKPNNELNTIQECEEEEKKEDSSPLRESKAGKIVPNIIFFKGELEIEEDYLKSSAKIQKEKEDFEGFTVVEEGEGVTEKESSQIQQSITSSTYSMSQTIASHVTSNFAMSFDEENLHIFNPAKQKYDKVFSLNIGKIELNIMATYEFDPSPTIIEINLDEKGKENTPKSETTEGLTVLITDTNISLYMLKKIETLRTNQDKRLALSIFNFEVLDFLTNSKGERNKVISKRHPDPKTVEKIKVNIKQAQDYLKKPKENTMANFLNLLVESFDQDYSKKPEIRTLLGIHPLRLYFCMPHLNFLKLFQSRLFNKMGMKTENIEQTTNKKVDLLSPNIKPPSPDGPFFIPIFCVTPFSLHLNVNLDISFINIDVLKDCVIDFKPFVARGVENTDYLQNKIIKFYKEAITPKIIIKDLPLFRNVKNLVTATFGLVYNPYSQYREDGNLLGGIKNGLSGFVGSLTSESMNLVGFISETAVNAVNKVNKKGNKNQ